MTLTPRLLWGHSMNYIFRVTIGDLEKVMEYFAEAMELNRRVCGLARARFEMMRKAGGGYFKQLNF